MTAGEGREVPFNSNLHLLCERNDSYVDRSQWTERLRRLKPHFPIYGERRELKMELVTSTDNNQSITPPQQTLHWTPEDIIHHISIASSPWEFKELWVGKHIRVLADNPREVWLDYSLTPNILALHRSFNCLVLNCVPNNKLVTSTLFLSSVLWAIPANYQTHERGLGKQAPKTL